MQIVTAKIAKIDLTGSVSILGNERNGKCRKIRKKGKVTSAYAPKITNVCSTKPSIVYFLGGMRNRILCCLIANKRMIKPFCNSLLVYFWMQRYMFSVSS